MTVGDPAALVSRLLAEGAPLAMGLDLPLGLPRAYAAGRPEPEGGLPPNSGFPASSGHHRRCIPTISAPLGLNNTRNLLHPSVPASSSSGSSSGAWQKH